MKSTAVPLGLLVLGLFVLLLLALTSRLRPFLGRYWNIGLYLDTARQRTVGWVMSIGTRGATDLAGALRVNKTLTHLV